MNKKKSELYVCPVCGESFPKNKMIEDIEYGGWYCFSCYEEILYYRMGGDSNGDLEDWWEY